MSPQSFRFLKTLSFLALLGFSCPLFADDQLPFDNAGFEDGLKGWTVNASNPKVAEVLPEAASLGAYGLRVRTLPGCAKYDVTSPAFPVTVGRTYTVSFWCGGGEVDGPSGLLVEMIFTGPNGELLKPAMARIRKWSQIEVRASAYFGEATVAAAAPEDAKTMAVRIRPNKGTTGGAVDFDDFKVVELADAPPAPPSPAASPAGPVFHPVPPSDPTRIKALLDDIKSNPYRGKVPPKIVIKLDDLKPDRGGVHPRWTKVVDFAKERNIKVAFGIIACSMEADSPNFYQWVKAQNASGMVEFWNHGYDHASWTENGKMLDEFWHSSYEHQKQHLTQAQELAHSKLGFYFKSFGAPFNATDEVTTKVLSEDPNTTVWMYGDVNHPGGKVVLDRCYPVTIENPTLIPNFGAFLEGYAHNRGSEYFVMQGHPTHWGDDRFDQFKQIVDFLMEQKATFVLPREFAENQSGVAKKKTK